MNAASPVDAAVGRVGAGDEPALEAGRRPSPSGEDGLAANRLADAAYRSWRAKRRVTLAWGEAPQPGTNLARRPSPGL